MLNKLRNKFIIILLSFTSIVLILGTIAICAILYKTELDNEDLRLTQIIEESVNNVNNVPNNKGGYVPPEIGGRSPEKPMNNPVSVFMQNEIGEQIIPVSAFTTATISQDVLSSVQDKIINSGSGIYVLEDSGLVIKKLEQKEKYYIAVSDIGNITYWKNIFWPLVFGDIAILLIFFILSIFLSKWSLKPVKEAWDKQKQFIADASHDLKTPLAVIMANNQILQTSKDKLISEEMQWIDSNQSESEKMLELINAMLDLARIEDPSLTKQELLKQFETINLSNLVELCCLQFDSVAFERNLTFNVNVEKEIFIYGIETKIANMIDTIISNSFKYAPDKDTITVNLKTNNKWAIIEMCNEKSVISKEDLPHVFDRFYRSDKSRKRADEKHQSHGLGLAISKSIVEIHGGEISVKSSAQLGTTFTVKLPIKK